VVRGSRRSVLIRMDRRRWGSPVSVDQQPLAGPTSVVLPRGLGCPPPCVSGTRPGVAHPVVHRRRGQHGSTARPTGSDRSSTACSPATRCARLSHSLSVGDWRRQVRQPSWASTCVPVGDVGRQAVRWLHLLRSATSDRPRKSSLSIQEGRTRRSALLKPRAHRDRPTLAGESLSRITR